MHVYADSDAIYLAQAAVGGTELGELIGRRIEELEPYDLPDLGSLIKVLVVEPDDDVMATVALWQLRLDSELVYVGDAGTTEPGRASDRRGIEATLRWKLSIGFRLDVDAA